MNKIETTVFGKDKDEKILPSMSGKNVCLETTIEDYLNYFPSCVELHVTLIAKDGKWPNVGSIL